MESRPIQVENITKLTLKSQKLLKSDKLRKLLETPELQIQLRILFEIYNNSSVTKESIKEERMEIAVKKLETLRAAGIHENQLVEEFCQLYESLSLDLTEEGET